MPALNAPHFHHDDKAHEHLESLPWSNSAVGPHYGSVGDHDHLEGKGGDKGTKGRRRLLKCEDCPE